MATGPETHLELIYLGQCCPLVIGTLDGETVDDEGWLIPAALPALTCPESRFPLQQERRNPLVADWAKLARETAAGTSARGHVHFT